MSKRIHFWIGIVVLGLAVLFTLQNVATVQVTLLFWAVRMPLAVLIFVIFVIGALAGWTIARVRRAR